MADTSFSSADNGISISGAQPTGHKNVLKGMKKDVRKRWIAVGALTAVSIALTSAWMSSGSSKSTVPERSPARSVVDTTPKGMSDQKDWRAQTGADLLTMKKSLDSSTAAQNELLASIKNMRQEISDLKEQSKRAPVPVPGAQAAPAAKPGLGLTLPEPPAPPKPSVNQIPKPPVSNLTPIAPPVNNLQGSKPAQTIKRAPARAFIPVGANAAGEGAESGLHEYVKNDKAGFLPAGSFSAATLISGVEAFTGGTAQSQPQPIVVRLDANAILPNAARYQIKGCHVLASVWGDMSSERVYGRLATLTCTDTKNKLVLSTEIEGVLVDSDGKNGIRGSLQDRQGAKLARSLLAGLAEGMSEAFGAAQTTSLATGAGITTALTGSSFKSAGYGGVGKAADQLSEFYLKQAEATMPVIAVDAGRRISVLFTKSQSLKFESIEAYRPKVEEKLTIQR